jgi:hypothetical protein
MFTFQAKIGKRFWALILGISIWVKWVVLGYKLWPWREIMEPLCYVSRLSHQAPLTLGTSMKYFGYIFAITDSMCKIFAMKKWVDDVKNCKKKCFHLRVQSSILLWFKLVWCGCVAFDISSSKDIWFFKN